MNKSILITENKIIKEDATEQVSSSLSFEKGLSFISNILKGILNITGSTLNDIAAGIELLGTTVLFPEAFKKKLESASKKRKILDREFETIKKDLGIDKPLEEFLNIAVPGSGFANEYYNKKITEYGNDYSLLKSLASPATALLNYNSMILSKMFGKKITLNEKDLDKNAMAFFEWYSKRPATKQAKINSWASANSDEWKKMLESMRDNSENIKIVIDKLKSEVLNENKVLTIKNKRLIIENEDQNPKGIIKFVQSVVEALSPNILSDLTANNIQKLNDESNEEIEALAKEYKEILDQNEDEVEKVLKKETETN